MTTKINGYPATTEPLTSLKARSGNAQVAESTGVKAPAPVSGSSSGADSVTLTDSALTLQKLGAAVASQPVVNAARVASVKQSVEAGTYQVKPATIAHKILGFESGLPSGK